MADAEPLEIDRDTRKRKWAAAQEEAGAGSEASGSGTQEAEAGRAAKNGAFRVQWGV